MFSISQIKEASKKVKSGADFPRFVFDLKSIGVAYYDNYVSNGQTIYYDSKNLALEGEAKYPEITIVTTSSSEKLKHALVIHQQGKTDYLTFCNQAANAGVEKWRTDMQRMTVTYFDKVGNHLVVEKIPTPKTE